MNERARVHRLSATNVPASSLKGPYTLVLADPPYYDEDAFAAARAIAESALVDDATVIVVSITTRPPRRTRSGGCPVQGPAARRHRRVDLREESFRDHRTLSGQVRPSYERSPRYRPSRFSSFEQVVVAPVELKQNSLFTMEERTDLLRVALADLKNIDVQPFSGLTVDFAKKVGATVIARHARRHWASKPSSTWP
jgi:hypothetical protein